jgi:hypothetical protein
MKRVCGKRKPGTALLEKALAEKTESLFPYGSGSSKRKENLGSLYRPIHSYDSCAVY